MAMTYFRLPKLEASSQRPSGPPGRQSAAAQEDTKRASSTSASSPGGDFVGKKVVPDFASATPIAFTTPIRTKGNSPMPASLATVAEAVEAIHGLPNEKQILRRWRRVLDALSRAEARPERPAMTDIAATELRAALLAEGWLH
jgi:hypothetical protein